MPYKVVGETKEGHLVIMNREEKQNGRMKWEELNNFYPILKICKVIN